MSLDQELPDLFSLPPELLSDITNFLNSPHDIFALASTSRAFRKRVLLDPEVGSYCCRCVEFGVSIRVVRPSFVCPVLPHVHRATVFLVPCRRYWEWISRTMPNLTCLTFEAAREDDESPPSTFSPNGEHLSFRQHLSLVSEILGSRIHELGLAFLPSFTMTELCQELGVESQVEISWKEILSPLFPNLTHLQLVTGDYLVPRTQHDRIGFGEKSDQTTPKTLWESGELEMFRTSLYSDRTGSQLHKSMPSLTSLDFYLTKISAAGADDCPLRSAFRKFRSLKSVYLGAEDFSGMTSGGIDSYGGTHLSLRSLTLNFAKISSSHVEPVRFLLRLCPNLETLSLSNSSFEFGCLQKSDVELLNVSKKLRDLDLVVLATDGRTDFYEVGDMVACLLPKFPRLVSLRLLVKEFVSTEEPDAARTCRSPKLAQMEETFSSLRSFVIEIEEDYGEDGDSDERISLMFPLMFEDLQRILRLCPCLDDLRIPLSDRAFVADVFHPPRFSEHVALEGLYLFGYGKVLTWSNFVLFVENLPCIQSLTFDSVVFEIDGSETVSPVNLGMLKKLDSTSSRVNEEIVRYLIQGSPQFERLQYDVRGVSSFCVESGNSFVNGKRFPTKNLSLQASGKVTNPLPLVETLLVNPLLESLFLSAYTFSSQRLLDSISSLGNIPLCIVTLDFPEASWQTLIAFVTVFGATLEEFKMIASRGSCLDDDDEEEEEEWEEEDGEERDADADEETKDMTLLPNSIPICSSLVKLDVSFLSGCGRLDFSGILLELLRAFPRAVYVVLVSMVLTSMDSNSVIEETLREFLEANGRQDRVLIQWVDGY